MVVCVPLRDFALVVRVPHDAFPSMSVVQFLSAPAVGLSLNSAVGLVVGLPVVFAV